MQGILRKLIPLQREVVVYQLPLSDELISLNEHLGKTISLTFEGQINCVACNRTISKSYQQGYCFPCTRKLAQCDFCVIQPNRCHFHLGTCREPEWGLAHCMILHWVYLANTSSLKVGITRAHQAPIRWMDQGATSALPIYEVKTRRHSGFLEALFATEISDKTHWQNMLKGIPPDVDLNEARLQLRAKLSTGLQDVMERFEPESIEWIENPKLYEFHYPVLEYPTKIKAFNFDSNPVVLSKLLGIKGQYLIFEEGVLNVRKFSGYNVGFKIE
ncbi:MAG: DUF2797 domain-containing protein [Gammaproteobacteria bacterium]